jgi:hypothetical protein
VRGEDAVLVGDALLPVCVLGQPFVISEIGAELLLAFASLPVGVQGYLNLSLAGLMQVASSFARLDHPSSGET